MSASVTSIEQKSAPEHPRGGNERVVLQFGDRVVRGFADRRAFDACLNAGGSVDAQTSHGQKSPQKSPSRDLPADAIPFHAIGSDGPEDLSLQGLKAAFFVKRFDGPGLDEMRFHDHLTPQETLWIRVVFRDGEVMEGLVDNQAAFLLNPGFLLTPTDPDANHWLVFVAKAQIREFHVLGLRPALKG